MAGRTGAMVVVAVLANGCGGGVEFNEGAVRSDLETRYPDAEPAEVDAAVESMRDMCGVDDESFVIVVAMASDETAAVGVDDLERACPTRTHAALAELAD